MQQVFSITQINEYIRGQMDQDRLLNQLAVRGEISNYKLYPSGHHYFTLKDENAALKCVMFKSNAARLRFRPENGMKIIAMGRITVYPRDGAFQLYCSGLTVDGVGDLYAAFEQLKKKLAAQGLFDQAHKKPLPRYPGTIGIVTSSAGAAVHDMLRILRKRYPLSRVRLLPVRVQGAEAPGEIAAAIAYANRYKLADLLIVSQVRVEVGAEQDVTVRPAAGSKCLRCWKVLPSVGSDSQHPELCPRCAAVVKNFPDLA